MIESTSTLTIPVVLSFCLGQTNVVSLSYGCAIDQYNRSTSFHASKRRTDLLDGAPRRHQTQARYLPVRRRGPCSTPRVPATCGPPPPTRPRQALYDTYVCVCPEHSGRQQGTLAVCRACGCGLCFLCAFLCAFSVLFSVCVCVCVCVHMTARRETDADTDVEKRGIVAASRIMILSLTTKIDRSLVKE